MDSQERVKRLKDEQAKLPFWKRSLLAVPKNLVYIFVVAICIAFVCMIYIANTEQGVSGFIST